MKRTVVDGEGTVRCPKCGGTQFTMKRTVKGKLSAGIAAPKRRYCLGCGASLKGGSARSSGYQDAPAPAPAAPVEVELGSRPSREEVADAAAAQPSVGGWRDVLTQDLQVGDQVRFSRKVYTVTGLEPGRMKSVKILVEGRAPLRGLSGTTWPVWRDGESS